MTCLAPSSNETAFHNENKFFPQMNNTFPQQWGNPQRKHTNVMEDFSSDEEAHLSLSQDKQQSSLDRLKDIDFHDLSMRATLLNAEYRYAQDESMTPNNRKRLFSEYNNSPDYRNNQEDGRYKLTLSQFATSASEQEPLYAEDEDVEEILMRLRHGHDYSYKPTKGGNPPPSLPSILFNPHTMARPPFPYHEGLPHPIPPPVAPSPNKASLFHILSQEPSPNGEHATLPHPHPHASYPHPHHQSVYNANLHHPMRKMFFDEAFGDGEEMGLEHPKKKQRRDGHGHPHKTHHAHPHSHGNKSPMKSIIVSNGEDGVIEKENVAAGLCFKTHKPKVQREYYYAKLSKTIFRWTCCGSQAKTHPDA